MQISQSFRDKLIILCFLGHNFRTTVGRKSSKGSTDSDFSLAYFTRKKGTIPCSLVSSRMMSSEKSRELPTFFTKKSPTTKNSDDSLWLQFFVSWVSRCSSSKPVLKRLTGKLERNFLIIWRIAKKSLSEIQKFVFFSKISNKRYLFIKSSDKLPSSEFK